MVHRIASELSPIYSEILPAQGLSIDTVAHLIKDFFLKDISSWQLQSDNILLVAIGECYASFGDNELGLGYYLTGWAQSSKYFLKTDNVVWKYAPFINRVMEFFSKSNDISAIASLLCLQKDPTLYNHAFKTLAMDIKITGKILRVENLECISDLYILEFLLGSQHKVQNNSIKDELIKSIRALDLRSPLV
ncbi:hypothetical protein BC829DRAFT_292574 [Chytridium lagenaria]|nr:hypothetical protein BC829DRAFT_292574 [Chytridium lagenaria]